MLRNRTSWRVRLAAAMAVPFFCGVGPACAEDLAIFDVSLARGVTPPGWPEGISVWRVAVGSSELTCEHHGAWLQSSAAGRCARGPTGSEVGGALVIAVVDETQVRVRYEGFEDVFEVPGLRIPVQKHLGPYTVTLMGTTWEKVPQTVKPADT